MGKYCRNCGKKLEQDVMRCPDCNVDVIDKRINVEERKNILAEYREKENKYLFLMINLLLLYFILYFLDVGSLEVIINFVKSLLFFVIVVLFAYVGITMGNSERIKTFFVVFISILIYFHFLLLLLFLLYSV